MTAVALKVHESQTNISELTICHEMRRDRSSISDCYRSVLLLLFKKKITFSLLFCGAVGANGVFFYLRHLEMFLGGYIVSAHMNSSAAGLLCSNARSVCFLSS